jgi:hypothetical protein
MCAIMRYCDGNIGQSPSGDCRASLLHDRLRDMSRHAKYSLSNFGHCNTNFGLTIPAARIVFVPWPQRCQDARWGSNSVNEHVHCGARPALITLSGLDSTITNDADWEPILSSASTKLDPLPRAFANSSLCTHDLARQYSAYQLFSSGIVFQPDNLTV